MKKMHPIDSLVVTLAMVLLLAVAGSGQPRTVSAFFSDFTDEWVRRDPVLATFTGYFSSEAQEALDRQLTPEDTAAFRRETAALARRGLAELALFDRSRMTDAERLSADVMAWQLEIAAAEARFSAYDYPLQQFRGANVRLPNVLTVTHPIRNEKDVRSYLVRLADVDTRIAEATALAADYAAAGVLPPRFILDATIAQMRRFATSAPRANPLVTTLVERMNRVPTLSSAVQTSFAESATLIVEREIYPAWQKTIAWLDSQLPRATDDAGLWRFKDGAAVYAHRLKQYTTTDMTATEIHELGLREVSRIEAEMDAILRQLGRTHGSIKVRVEALSKELKYPETDEGRARIMADIEMLIRDAEKRAEALFDVRPRARVIAQPHPQFQWATAAAGYAAPPLDGSRPGIYQMPLRAEYLTKFGLRTLVYHETVPGHHFQIALSVEDTRLPKFRQIRAFGGMSAVSEGWALYAERLAAEEGWYDGDLEGRLGQLDAELFRARRLVVDTGLHAMRWTRQQAIDYGIEASEVDRYVVFPGQACSYKIGQLDIIRLRDKVRTALGARFRPGEFHNVVLAAGVVPLAVLEQQVNQAFSLR